MPRDSFADLIKVPQMSGFAKGLGKQPVFETAFPTFRKEPGQFGVLNLGDTHRNMRLLRFARCLMPVNQ